MLSSLYFKLTRVWDWCSFCLSVVCSRSCANGATLKSESCICSCADGYSGDNCGGEYTAYHSYIFLHLATPQMLKIRMQYCVTNCPHLPRISYTAVSLNAQRHLGLDCWLERSPLVNSDHIISHSTVAQPTTGDLPGPYVPLKTTRCQQPDSWPCKLPLTV